MTVSDEKYNWLANDKSIVIDDYKKIRQVVKIKSKDKKKPVLTSMCASYWRSRNGYSSNLVLI